jgi:hypothetical protein
MRHVATVFAEAPYWQMAEKYWNIAMQENKIWFIAYKAHSKEILQEV